MRISLRSSLLIAFAFAMLFAYFNSFKQSEQTRDAVHFVIAVCALFGMITAVCGATASIAYDHSGTRRAAEQGAFYGFVLLMLVGIVLGLLTPSVNTN